MLGPWSNVPAKVDTGRHNSFPPVHPSRPQRAAVTPYLYISSAASTLPPARKSSTNSSLVSLSRKISGKKLNTSSRSSQKILNNISNHNKSLNDVNSKRSLKVVASSSDSKVKNRRTSQTSVTKPSSKRSDLSSTTSMLVAHSQASTLDGSEPFDEKISKDIAAAVAMIVAEYELLGDENTNEQGQSESSTSGIVRRKKPKPSQEDVTTSTTSFIGNEPAAPPSKTDSKTVSTSKEAGALPEADTATPDTPPNTTPNNNPIPSEPEPQPGTEAGREQAQSSQLPEDVEAGPTNKDSTATIGIEIPREAPIIKKYARSVVLPPTASKDAKLGGHGDVRRHLNRVQNYINNLTYHREGEPRIGINVKHSMKTHMFTARELIIAGRPIKCLHAVALAVYLTNSLGTVERFPIYFRSHVGDREYKHIVLGVYCLGHFGALGISRDAGLQDKKIIYTKLSDLILEFANSYQESGHILNEVKLGNIITHDQTSLEKIFNKIGTIPIHNQTQEEIEANVEKIAKMLRAKMCFACIKSSYDSKNFNSTPIHPIMSISPGPIPTGAAASARKSRSRVSVRNMGTNSNAVNLASSSTNAMRPRALSLGPNVLSTIRMESDARITVGTVKSTKSVQRTKSKTSKLNNKRKAKEEN